MVGRILKQSRREVVLKIKEKIRTKRSIIMSENLFLLHADRFILEAELAVATAQANLQNIHDHKRTAPAVISDAQMRLNELGKQLKPIDSDKIRSKIAAMRAKIERLENELK